MEILRLDVYQFAPRLADPDANLGRIAHLAARSTADIFLTPELSVTGYDLGDEATYLALPVGVAGPLADTQFSGIRTSVLLGLCERGEDSITYNTIVVVQDGLVRFRHRKVYLPTYGMFDEGRFFGRGKEVTPWSLGPWRVGVLVCEDLWHPGLVYVLACAGIHVLLVAAAAPGRGLWSEAEASAEHDGRFASAASWERIARCYAQLYGIYVALANRTGVEGSSTFAGGSLIVAPDGRVLARAAEDDETVLHADLDLAEVGRARRPFSHARDEDSTLVIRSLQRLGNP